MVFDDVGKLNVIWPQMIELVQHLEENELSNVSNASVRLTNNPVRDDYNLVVDNAVFKVALLSDVKLNIILWNLDNFLRRCLVLFDLFL